MEDVESYSDCPSVVAPAASSARPWTFLVVMTSALLIIASLLFVNFLSQDDPTDLTGVMFGFLSPVQQQIYDDAFSRAAGGFLAMTETLQFPMPNLTSLQSDDYKTLRHAFFDWTDVAKHTRSSPRKLSEAFCPFADDREACERQMEGRPITMPADVISSFEDLSSIAKDRLLRMYYGTRTAILDSGRTQEDLQLLGVARVLRRCDQTAKRFFYMDFQQASVKMMANCVTDALLSQHMLE